MYSHVVLVVGGAGEASSAAGLWAHVRSLACVGADVNLPDVGGGEGTPTSFKRTFKWLLTYKDRMYISYVSVQIHLKSTHSLTLLMLNGNRSHINFSPT